MHLKPWDLQQMTTSDVAFRLEWVKGHLKRARIEAQQLNDLGVE